MFRHAVKTHTPSIPFYPKSRFTTSFGPSIEYLVIPASLPPARAGPACPDKDAPTILFLNGIMLRFSQWALQLPSYTETHGLPGLKGRNLILLNNLGHGGSGIGSAKKEDYIRLCAQAAIELLSHLDVRTTGIITQSMGTLIALEFQSGFKAAGGSVDRMAFVSPVLCSPMRVFPYDNLLAPRVGAIRSALSDDEFVARLDTFLKAATNPLAMRVWHRFYKTWTGSTISFPDFSSMIRKALSMDARTFVTAYDAMESEGDRIGRMLSGISTPSLALLGRHDFITDHDKTELLIKTLNSTMDIVSLEGCAHWSNSEKPEKVNPVLSDFFS